MEVRTYYSNSVEEAFAQARRDFGSEAMLMQSRIMLPGSERAGEYEVVFAGEQTNTPAVPLEKAPRREQTAFRAAKPPAPRPLPRSVPPQTPFLHVTCDPGLGRSGQTSTAVALVGPTGSGKSTMAMKLIIQYGLLAARPCRLIAYDPDRVGTAERLRHFSELLHIPFHAVDSAPGISALLQQNAPGLTLIDTPGITCGDDQILASLAFLFQTHRDLESQLVLRADRRLADNIATAGRLSSLAPNRLIMTALDDTSGYRELGALAAAAALPLSFFGTGQKIPGGLEAASIRRLEEFAARGSYQRTSSAAA